MTSRRPDRPQRRSSSYYDDANFDRPRLARQPSRGSQVLGAIQDRNFSGAIDAFRRSRSVDPPRRPRQRRYDSYSDWDTDSDSDVSIPRSRTRHRSTTSRRSTSRRSISTRHRHDPDQKHVLRQAASAALAAGAAEAWRVRKERARWSEKGTRVATAAAGAAAIAAFKDDRPTEKKKRSTVQATIGGLLLSRLANGSKHDTGSRRR